MLREFAPKLYVADGPTVSFHGFAYPTRMALVRLANGSVWVWSPIALTDALISSVDELGEVAHIVSPNKIHHLFLDEWSKRWPQARVYAPPGLAQRLPGLRVDEELTDEANVAWREDIEQVIFHGSLVMDEVVFFHKPSRTAIVGDLIQRHPESTQHGWKGALMRLNGLVGQRGSTPREWRASFVRRGQARAARDKLLGWEPERLLIAHGDCAPTGGASVIQEALAWI